MENDTDTSRDSTPFDDGFARGGGSDDALPGFRFHPTDAELVGFYLRRKVDKKPLKFDFIKQVDIYKYDPWELSSNVADDKEGYFFCKRGRKYRNSIRPNRVTGSGFWKATGIDKPVYSHGDNCIGLKKTLVYYCGSAGKGTKTNWMMHEFRLPPTDGSSATSSAMNIKFDASPTREMLPEAEVWTLCRIFKRSDSHRRCMPEWREQSSANKDQSNHTSSRITCASKQETLLCFSAPAVMQHFEHQPSGSFQSKKTMPEPADKQWEFAQSYSLSTSASPSSFQLNPFGDDVFSLMDFDELRPVVDFAFNKSNLT